MFRAELQLFQKQAAANSRQTVIDFSMQLQRCSSVVTTLQDMHLIPTLDWRNMSTLENMP